MAVLKSTTAETTMVFLSLLCQVVRSISTPTPPLPGQISLTTTLLMEETVWLNPTASLYAPDASSSVHVSANAGCGGNISSPAGELTHPSYPLDIQGTAHCTWRISLEKGTRVSLFFNFLSLDDCSKDFLEVWDGLDSSKVLLKKKYCGRLEKSERLVSKRNEVEVVLRANSSSSGRGFLVTYSTFTECSKNFTNLTGLIQTPHYPQDYPCNIQCAYSINVPAGHQIALSLEFLDLVYSPGCSQDVLEIWDGNNESSVPIGRYCGYLFSQWVRSKGNELRMKFRSDLSNTRRGFQLKYYAIKSDCNSTLNATRGSIASPQQADSPCYWTINSPPSHVISLRFDRFFLKLSKDCAHDYLVVRDGKSVIGRYCGYQKGEFLYSKTNSITLEYISTSIDDSSGFQIQYKHLVLPDCGGYLNNSRGSLQSRLFPDKYPGNVRCAWQIEQLPGHVIDLVFDDFDLEFSVNCTKDYFEVFDGPDNTSVSLGRYCGVKRPDDHVTSSGNMMFVEFVADGRISRRGFSVGYTGIKSDCPQNFTNATGKFESPNYPDFYPKNYDCYWQISYALGYQIYLTFKYFDLEYTPNCVGDYVEILDGTVENATLIKGKYCGYLVKRYPLVSTKNQLLIRFHADDQRGSRGFVFTYEVDGTDYPPLPRFPTSNEVKQAVQMVFYNLTTSQWITNMDVAFKKLVANATTLYCADHIQECRLMLKEMQRRSTENFFTQEHVHLVPGFPSSGEDFSLVVVFYALYPLATNVDPKWSSNALPQNALLNAVRYSQDYISSVFSASIKSIEPYNVTETPSPPIVTANENLVIGLAVGGTFLLLFVFLMISCFFWRKKNHGKFLVKRCVTPIEFVDERDEIQLKKVMTQKFLAPARRRASTLQVVDLDGNIH